MKFLQFFFRHFFYYIKRNGTSAEKIEAQIICRNAKLGDKFRKKGMEASFMFFLFFFFFLFFQLKFFGENVKEKAFSKY